MDDNPREDLVELVVDSDGGLKVTRNNPGLLVCKGLIVSNCSSSSRYS